LRPAFVCPKDGRVAPVPTAALRKKRTTVQVRYRLDEIPCLVGAI